MKFHEVEYLQINYFSQGHYCAVLRWNEKKRIIPLWISAIDAEAQIAREESSPPRRPRMHDVFIETVNRFAGGLKELRITHYYQGMFIASFITNDGEEIDCRPSDGIAVAYSLSLPIFASEEVLAGASIFVSESDLSRWFGLEFTDDPLEQWEENSASGNPDEDESFSQLMASLGVSEHDLLGADENSKENGIVDNNVKDEDTDTHEL